MSCAAAAVALVSFVSGIGEWSPGASDPAALTHDEECYVERAWPQAEGCADRACRDNTALAIRDVINLRRRLNATFVGDVVFDALRSTCDALEGAARAQRDCYYARSKLTFEEGMREAGFRPAGVTMAGYRQLQIGLRMKEIEYILGGPGDEVSYVASGGYSLATYRWSEGRGSIIVSLKDGELGGRSQFGLR